MIKPAYSFSFLLSINIFEWQNVLYFLDAPRIIAYCGREGQIYAAFRFCLITLLSFFLINCVSDSFKRNLKRCD